jgi:hypothetical protein
MAALAIKRAERVTGTKIFNMLNSFCWLNLHG